MANKLNECFCLITIVLLSLSLTARSDKVDPFHEVLEFLNIPTSNGLNLASMQTFLNRLSKNFKCPATATPPPHGCQRALVSVNLIIN